MNPIGCNSDQLEGIMRFCGYEVINVIDNKKLYFFKQLHKIDKKSYKKNNTKKIIDRKTKPKKKLDPNSPFAVLEKLL